ncbi:MAG TPA: hydrogenase formation protein HypD [Bacteroidales bacterium]|nr:hydrogenase formation protein HypD [Bacteroidales bacterium]HRT89293.1 hydrogenase formation protein HypD [Bacteroidales bacterium]
MKFISEYRDSRSAEAVANAIRHEARRNYTFMEVCGGHTAAIHRFGIPSILPPEIKLLSGPGCPVCVTPLGYVNKAVALSLERDVIITSFGDLIRVPGSSSSLWDAKASGADVRIVISALDAVDLAAANPDKKVVFMGIGFETTAPGTAAAINRAAGEDLKNFCVLSGHKIMPPAMEAVIREGTAIDGFICPGHVATITGSSVFDFIPRKYGLGCVVSGFEPADILLSILMLVRQVNSSAPACEIEYSRVVTAEGNLKAKALMNKVFQPEDSEWRGLGNISLSGLGIHDAFRYYDASVLFDGLTGEEEGEENPSCLCGEVLRGRKRPSDCRLFAKSCTPENPAGACMVSSEGACNAFYRFKKDA